jgi:hypothetical protein
MSYFLYSMSKNNQSLLFYVLKLPKCEILEATLGLN